VTPTESALTKLFSMRHGYKAGHDVDFADSGCLNIIRIHTGACR